MMVNGYVWHITFKASANGLMCKTISLKVYSSSVSLETTRNSPVAWAGLFGNWFGNQEKY